MWSSLTPWLELKIINRMIDYKCILQYFKLIYLNYIFINILSYGFINAKMKNHEYCSLAKLIKYILPIHFRFDFSKEY